jgi:hypothetical protein
MDEAAEKRQAEDWEEVHEVAIALLGLTEHHRKDRLRVRPEIPFLDTFEQEGWIEDSNTCLGWVELTEAGQARAREMLRKHFGIVLPGPGARVEPPRD